MTAVRSSTTGGDYINVKHHGLAGDGSTNDTSAFNTLVAATSVGTLFFPSGTYKLDATAAINQPALHLLGDGATITPTVSNGGVITTTAVREITGFAFTQTKLLFPSTMTGPTSIHGNDFSGSTGAYGSGTIYGTANTSTGVFPQKITIRDNTFTGHSWAIHGCFNDCLIDGNVFTASTSRNIEIFAGSGNRITNNYITGGVTGIIWLTDRVYGGNYASLNNVITGNVVEGISEEGISTDLQGNVTASSGALASGTISSGLTLNGGFLQFVPSYSTPTANAYLNTYLVMLTGKAKGKLSKVTSMGAGGTTNLLTTETNLAGYTVGDTFALIIPNIGFTITDNAVTGGVQTGINHWGCAFNTVIANNHVSDCLNYGIKVSSIYGVPGGPGYYGPCGNIQIHDNVVSNCPIQIGAGGPATPDITAIGSRVYNNTLLGGSSIAYNFQEAYQVWNNEKRDQFPPTYSTTTGFESGTVSSNFDTVLDAGVHLSLDASDHNTGSQSLKLTGGGNPAYGSYTPTSGVRNLSLRFAFKADALPASGSPGFFRIDVGSGTNVGSLALFSTGSIHFALGTGATNQTVATISAATWYWIDLKINTTSTSFTGQVKITTVMTGAVFADPGAIAPSTGETPADITDVRFGASSSSLLNIVRYDDVWVTNSSTWPLLPSAKVVPTDGSWSLGDKVYNPVPVSGGTEGYICTTGGSPGTWSTFGVIG